MILIFSSSKKKNKDLIFAHNGTISVEIDYKPHFQPFGTTDSEKWTYHLLSHNVLKFPQRIPLLIKKLNIENGSNFILSSPLQTILYVYYKKYPRYFSMALQKKKEGIIICSEPLKEELPWKILPQGTLLIINHQNLSFTSL